jgi:hypothetical protein
MNYVELHSSGGGLQIRFVPKGDRDEPFVTNADFIGPILGQLGVHSIGPWESATGPEGETFHRAQILGQL